MDVILTDNVDVECMFQVKVRNPPSEVVNNDGGTYLVGVDGKTLDW